MEGELLEALFGPDEVIAGKLGPMKENLQAEIDAEAREGGKDGKPMEKSERIAVPKESNPASGSGGFMEESPRVSVEAPPAGKGIWGAAAEEEKDPKALC